MYLQITGKSINMDRTINETQIKIILGATWVMQALALFHDQDYKMKDLYKQSLHFGLLWNSLSACSSYVVPNCELKFTYRRSRFVKRTLEMIRCIREHVVKLIRFSYKFSNFFVRPSLGWQILQHHH